MARGGTNYIPRPDGDFSAWANHYYEAVYAYYDRHHLDPELLAALRKALDTWNGQYPAHVAAQAAAESARRAKDTARAELEAEIRPVTNFVQSYPSTTDADRAEIGITVRETSRTPSPKPTTRPLVSVDVSARLTHELRLVDSGDGASTRGRRGRGGKPEGVAGAEVWVKLVEPGTGHQALGTGEGNGSVISSGRVPSAQSQVPGFSFLTMTTRPTLRTDFPTSAGGKTAVYMLRWVNTRGEKGPWSEVTTATVAA
ncbi:MAG: hypothetical protein IBJ18_10540 [Phycisphaerales bacterium]|nr:hypothetical protein [Phycisphaerales bacterium]